MNNYLKYKNKIKEYRLKNMDKIRQKSKEYYLKNKEKIKKYTKNYRLRNKEKTKIYMKKYRLSHHKSCSRKYQIPPMLGKKHKTKTIEKMRKIKLGKKNPNFWNNLTDYKKKKIIHFGRDNGMYGKHHSKETIIKISNKLKGRTSHNKGIKNKLLYKVCELCGKIYETYFKEQKFCRISCSSKSKIGIKLNRNFFGKNNPNWRGGIHPISQAIRNSIKYNEWRLKVYKKDKFTCNYCNIKGGGDLVAHHIKNFSELLKEAQSNFPLLNLYDAAMIYEPLWDIGNGITFHRSCHLKFHKKGG